ncbi:hypothetical protein GF354_01430 [Candidatus Peregrinibacteria bacterium]|nr:hypothetical protein [Candidatus Peregrinibacteria bacterium]
MEENNLNLQTDSTPKEEPKAKCLKVWHLIVAFVVGGLVTAGVFLVPSFGGQGFIGADQGVTDPMSGVTAPTETVTDSKYLTAEELLNEAQDLRADAMDLLQETYELTLSDDSEEVSDLIGLALNSTDDFELAGYIMQAISLAEDQTVKSNLEDVQDLLSQAFSKQTEASGKLAVVGCSIDFA